MFRFTRPWNLMGDLKNSRTPFPCPSKLCAPFHSNLWILKMGLSPETVKSGQIGDFLASVTLKLYAWDDFKNTIQKYNMAHFVIYVVMRTYVLQRVPRCSEGAMWCKEGPVCCKVGSCGLMYNQKAFYQLIRVKRAYVQQIRLPSQTGPIGLSWTYVIMVLCYKEGPCDWTRPHT